MLVLRYSTAADLFRRCRLKWGSVSHQSLILAAVTAIKVVLLVFISIVGYTRAGPTCEDTSQCVGMSCADYCQLQGVSSATDPFFDPDFGANGVFLGAAALFFTYTGMDAICNAAEEVGMIKHPGCHPSIFLSSASSSIQHRCAMLFDACRPEMWLTCHGRWWGRLACLCCCTLCWLWL